MDRKEINVNTKTKGVIVYATPKIPGKIGDWILLVSYVKLANVFGDGKKYEMIYIYASIAVKGEHLMTPCITKYPFSFGITDNFNFYEATKEERKQIQNKLKRMKWKYVKAINKIIDR